MEGGRSKQFDLVGLLVGTLLALALNYVFIVSAMSVAPDIFSEGELRAPTQQFWLMSAFSWVISVQLGVLCGLFFFKSEPMTLWMLHGVLIWAGSYLFSGGLLKSISELSMDPVSGALKGDAVKIGFLGDLGSLLAAIATVALAYGVRHRCFRSSLKNDWIAFLKGLGQPNGGGKGLG